ncbi:MAG TPA: hypothetical protein PK954_16095 [Anaerolineales bacterium]|nr:hypothetical protein [Anaerolineales bacterium]HRF50439.1 hypothetical protein [Anaerolineales bacterium]
MADPLSGKRIAYTHTGTQAEELAQQLVMLGAVPLALPVPNPPLLDEPALKLGLEHREDYAALVFDGATVVQEARATALKLGLTSRDFAGAMMIARNRRTHQALEAWGVDARTVGALPTRARVLVLGGGRKDPFEDLSAAHIDQVPDIRPPLYSAATLTAISQGIDALALIGRHAPHGLSALIDRLPPDVGDVLAAQGVVCVGVDTASAAELYGFDLAELASPPTLPGLIQALARFVTA